VCASVTGGTGFCVDGNTPCSGLGGCGTSADCALGSVCAVGSCCGRNVCVSTDQCGGYTSSTRRGLPLGEREWLGATVGHEAVWVEGEGDAE
jgi:hypothetical protein